MHPCGCRPGSRDSSTSAHGTANRGAEVIPRTTPRCADPADPRVPRPLTGRDTPSAARRSRPPAYDPPERIRHPAARGSGCVSSIGSPGSRSRRPSCSARPASPRRSRPQPVPGAPALAGTEWVLASTGAGGTDWTRPDRGERLAPDRRLPRVARSPAAAAAATGTWHRHDHWTRPSPLGHAASTRWHARTAEVAEQQYFTALGTVAALHHRRSDTDPARTAAAPRSWCSRLRPAATLEGAWVVTGYNNGKHGVETPPDGPA